MIYTSYFEKLKKLPDHITPIAICGKVPEGWTGLRYIALAPKYRFFSEWELNHDNQYYINCYYDQVLSKLDPDRVVDELMDIVNTNDIALICYEKPGDFCHRHIVAEWLKSPGYRVEEWESDDE